jgi:long-chain acyl-CoA synthetase
VARKDAKLTEQDVQQIVSGKLAAYKHLNRVQFVAQVPKSQPGKLLRNELRKLATEMRAKL